MSTPRSDPPLAPLASCRHSTQLLCLPAYLDNADLARDVHGIWAQLASACHAHAHDLDPTIDELTGWSDTVARLLDELPSVGNASRAAPTAAPRPPPTA